MVRAEHRRHRERLAFEAAFHEWEKHAYLSKRGGVLPPLAYLRINSGIVELVERNDFSAEAIARVYKGQAEFIRALEREGEKFDAAMKAPQATTSTPNPGGA